MWLNSYLILYVVLKWRQFEMPTQKSIEHFFRLEQLAFKIPVHVPGLNLVLVDAIKAVPEA